MKRNIALFSLLIIPLLMGLKHPFFVAVIEAEYISKNKELGISIKVYPDDLEATLKNTSQKSVNLSAKNKDENNMLIDSYVKKHLGIKINGISKSYEYLGYEYVNEAIMIYFSIPSLRNVKSIEINTDLMYDYKEEQTNIVHLVIDGQRCSSKLNAPNKRTVCIRE